MLNAVGVVLMVSFLLNACASKQDLQGARQSKWDDLFSATPREAVSLLARNDEISSLAYEGIESGESKWLDLYKTIRPVSDASVSESLDQSIGLAISRAPSAAIDVLAEVSKGKANQQAAFQYLNWPCGATSADFSESEGSNIKERSAKDMAIRELQAKNQALQSIKSVNLKTANECKEIAQLALKRWKSK